LAAATEFCPLAENQPGKKFGQADDGVSATLPKKSRPSSVMPF